MPNEEKSNLKNVISAREELDNFWSIDSLIPPKKKSIDRRISSSNTNSEAVDIEFGEQKKEVTEHRINTAFENSNNRPYDTEAEQIGNIHYVPPHTAEDESCKPIFEYKPSGLLIHRVKVYKWQTSYHYFGSFVEEAQKYDRSKPEYEAPYEPFFSFFPQYAQLNRRQKAFYLYWREQIRRGEFLKTDYSYIMLYIFELINIPHTQESALRARDIMALLWRNYHKIFPRLDGCIAEWLCDFCLINGIPSPELLSSSELRELAQISQLKEFYLDTVSTRGEASDIAHFFMNFCCSYDYRKSKFASGENKKLFDSIIPQTLGELIPYIVGVNNAERPVVTMQDSEITRDSYTGALCSFNNKLRLTVYYTSFSRSHELRFLIGDIVRHIENRLRAWIGVRSRLSVMSLPTELRDIADKILTPHLPPIRQSIVRREEVSEYEKMYELPHVDLSLKGAAEIEASSWETTRILTEAFDGCDDHCDNEEFISDCIQCNEDRGSSDLSVITDNTAVSEEQALINELGELLRFLEYALTEDFAAQHAMAKERKTILDALADAVNEITANSYIMDIVLEGSEMGGYRVIEDYREIVKELLKKGGSL